MMKRALIADDNAENLYLLRVLLQGHGFTVDEARNGDEALIAARARAPDLMISDLLMPVVDGYALLRQWRADERLQSIPFVVYTATYTEPRDERLALALGADAFIVKPAEPEALMERLGEVLQGLPKAAKPAVRPVDDVQLLKDYNEIVISKLEKRSQQLENANRELRAEVAARKRAEESLRLRDRAIQEVSQGILIVDPGQPDYPVIYASAGVERITGYKPQEIAGRNCRILQGAGTDRGAIEKLRAAIAAGQGCAVELLNYRRDGTPFWNALSINPVRDDAGTLRYFVGVMDDVSERRRLESQLRQAQKMEAVGRLAGGVAHDFNNLLTVIYGATDQLRAMPSLDAAARGTVTLIGDAAERAAALTRQILAFSRQTILQPTVYDLNAGVADASKLLRRMIGDDIELKTVLAPNLPSIMIDPGQIGQILMNLSVNARDAMPEGGTLKLETAGVHIGASGDTAQAGCNPGPHVMLAVTDTGHGMAPEVLAHIFEPFYTTKDVGKGTGLGLATVFGIVRQSGGCIVVTSAPKRGTAFRIYFPAFAMPPEEIRGDDAPGEPPGDAAPCAPACSETILLVEDDAAIREVILATLTARGYKVLTAKNGGDALEMARSLGKPPDLLLTDVVMPAMKGPELAEALRARLPELKILYMSGYADDAVIRRSRQQSAVSFLQKPFSARLLARKVRELLDMR